MEWHDELFVAANGPHGRIRVFQKVQNFMMHAGSRTQALPRYVVFRWVRPEGSRKSYLQVLEKDYQRYKDFFSSKLTFEDEKDLEKRALIEQSRKQGIPHWIFLNHRRFLKLLVGMGYRFDLGKYELDLGSEKLFFKNLEDLEAFVFREGLVSDYVFWALDRLYLLRSKLATLNEKRRGKH